MKTVMQNFAVGLLAASAAVGSSQSPGTTPEMRVRALGAERSQESTFASAPCKRASENRNHRIIEQPPIDPKTLVPDLNTLVEKSDEIVLAGISFRTSSLLSPSGQSAVRYFDVMVMRSWKGNHKIGDILTFGIPSVSVRGSTPG